jgi:hypothetical protein
VSSVVGYVRNTRNIAAAKETVAGPSSRAVFGLVILWVRTLAGAWMSAVIVVCCQVEVSATS